MVGLCVVVAEVVVVSGFKRWRKRRHNGLHNGIRNLRCLPPLNRDVRWERGEERTQRIAVTFEDGGCKVALSSIGGQSIEVAGRHVLATSHLKRIAYAIAICIVQAIAITVVPKGWELTGVIGVDCVFVVVAS